MKSLLLAVSLTVFAPIAPAAMAQDFTLPGLSDLGGGPDDKPSAHDGSGVFHGNYCGLGDRGPGLPPTDALDRACMHHDACTPSGGTPSCACNARFRREVHAVATSRRQPDELRALAGTVEAAVPLIPCR